MTAISFQLYSARNAGDFSDLLKLLSSAGYAHVEGYGAQYEAPEQTLAALKSAGLNMPSGHFSLQMLEEETDTAISVAKTLGITRIYCPYLDESERPNSTEGWTALGNRLQVISERVTAAGFQFGWHNHDFEFHRLPDGRIPMDVLLEAAPSISWEADIAWIVRGGEEPFEWIDKYQNRLSAAHVKDIAPAGECVDEDGWADVGHGTMDWQALVYRLKDTPVDLLIVEHDNPKDIERFAKRAFASLSNFLK